MQKLLIAIAVAGLILITLPCWAQHLPPKSVISLSDKQVMRIDSAINMASNQMDSKQFTQWFLKSFEPFYIEIKKQMVVDTIKAKKP